MLVLSRKAGEDILIGNHIAVSVMAIQGKRVKLAFTAPNEVAIRRAELVVANDEPSCLADELERVGTKPK